MFYFNDAKLLGWLYLRIRNKETGVFGIRIVVGHCNKMTRRRLGILFNDNVHVYGSIMCVKVCVCVCAYVRMCCCCLLYIFTDYWREPSWNSSSSACPLGLWSFRDSLRSVNDRSSNSLCRVQRVIPWYLQCSCLLSLHTFWCLPLRVWSGMQPREARQLLDTRVVYAARKPVSPSLWGNASVSGLKPVSISYSQQQINAINHYLCRVPWSPDWYGKRPLRLQSKIRPIHVAQNSTARS